MLASRVVILIIPHRREALHMRLLTPALSGFQNDQLSLIPQLALPGLYYRSSDLLSPSYYSLL